MNRPRKRPAVGDRTGERCTPREYNAHAGSFKFRTKQRYNPAHPRLLQEGHDFGCATNAAEVLGFGAGRFSPADIRELSRPTLVLEGVFGRLKHSWPAFIDFPNRRSHDGGSVRGMMKLESHSPADESNLQHRAAPGRPGNGDRHGAGTELRMPPDQRLVVAKEHRRITVMLRLDLQN